MRWAGGEPIYFGPRLSWPYLVLVGNAVRRVDGLRQFRG